MRGLGKPEEESGGTRGKTRHEMEAQKHGFVSRPREITEIVRLNI